ncbi:MAG: thiamine pyrophosphokinase [Cyclobacteriaceae bacterium]|jgi:thiamine pyrophosphokinase
MSSHHIVRDEQEPSLLIHKLNPGNWPVILELLEWSPTVVVPEELLDEIISKGHKVDIALVRDEHVEDFKVLLQSQNPIEIKPAVGDKLWPLVLATLSEKNHRAINVVTDNASLFGVINQMIQWGNGFDVVIYTEDQKHILSKRMLFKKWLPAFSQLAIVPLHDQTFASTYGFDLNLDNERMSDGLSLSKKLEGEVTIKMTKVPFLISETLC